MYPTKVDSAGTHVYTPPTQLSPTWIHIIGGDPAHLLNGNHNSIWRNIVRIQGITMTMLAPSTMTTRNMNWGTMMILMGLKRIIMLPVRLMSPIWMRLTSSQAVGTMFPSSSWGGIGSVTLKGLWVLHQTLDGFGQILFPSDTLRTEFHREPEVYQ